MCEDGVSIHKSLRCWRTGPQDGCVGIYYSREQKIKKVAIDNLENKRRVEKDTEKDKKETNVRTGVNK